MIAKIRNKDKIYDSVVFAFSYNNRKSKVVVFDETYSKLIVINYSWNSDVSVMFTNYECENYKINKDRLKIYWDNKNFFKTVEQEKYDEKIFQEAKKIQSKLVHKEWYEINNIYDLKGLIFTVGDFHDACVIKIDKKEDYAEILIDTTWGLYVLLKCFGIIENTLDLNYYFDDCKYSYDNGIIEIIFDDEFSRLEKLKCKKIEYKYYFEKNYKIKTFNIEADTLICNYGEKDEIKINLNSVDKKIFNNDKTINIGMMKCSDIISTYTFAQDDYFIVLKFYPMQNESDNKYRERFFEIKEKLNDKGLTFYDIYQEEIIGDESDSFGNIIYKEELNSYKDYLYFFKYITIPLIGNILFWLIVQLCNHQMKWMVFLVFGIGISLITLVFASIIWLIKLPKFKNAIILYDDGIVCSGTVNISIAYTAIIEARYDKRIILVTNFGELKMLRSRNNKFVFELIVQKINEAK